MDQSIMNFADSTARGSALGTAVAEGMVSYLNNTDSLEVYRTIGTAAPVWNPVAFESYVDAKPVAGLVPVIAPTVNFSGGTATANSLGTISFTTVTGLSLNNIFTSSHRNYLLVISLTANSANSSLSWRMRVSGTDNTTSNYYTGGVGTRITSTTVAFAVNGGSAGSLSWINGQTFVSFNLTNPAIAARTNGYSTAMGGDGTSIAGINAGQSFLADTVFDGLTIFPAVGSMTGTIQVFGYRN
jgi:hypothetical protein